MWGAKECARRLGRSYSCLKRWRKIRKGPPFLRIEGRIFYRPDDVSAWLDERGG